MTKKFKLSQKITLIVLTSIILCSIAIGYFSYATYRDKSIERLSDHLLGVARFAATLIDPAQYREIMASLEPNEYHEWLTRQFHEKMIAHDVFFIHAGTLYPERGDSGEFVGFVEALPLGLNVGLGEVTPGYQYPTEAFTAMTDGVALVAPPARLEEHGLEEHGTVAIGAYAPVFDENGETIAIVSVTVIDAGVMAASVDFFRSIVMFVVAAILISVLIPGIFIRRSLQIPMSNLFDLTSVVVSGNFDKETGISYKNEIELLSVNFAMMKTMAYHDALTGTYNRRYMEDFLERTMQTMKRAGGGKLSFMMIDIDFFKKFNDTYGHTEGDTCLKRIAEVLMASATRADDIVARYGGEEFAVIMPNTDECGARMMAERMLDAVRVLNIPHEKSDAASHVTISIGVATGIVDETQSELDYEKRADEALYMSKKNGRNQYTYLGMAETFLPGLN